MRSFNPLLVVGLAALMVFGVVPAASAETTVTGTVGYFSYSADSAGATVVGYNTAGGNTVSIPAAVTLNNVQYVVTTIGAGAFAYKALTSVIIPDSVTTIGGSAFQSNRLASVTIGNSVTTIGVNAFYINTLTSVTIPDSVTTIGAAAFYTNALTSVTIPNSVTAIGGQAFYDNNSLSSVQFLGAAPIMGSASLGSSNGLLVSYFSRYEAPAVSGGFTTPTWTANTYNNTYNTQALVDVNYSTNGGGGTAPAASQPTVGSRLTAPADPSRAGHTFTGWFTAVSDGTAWNFSTNTVTADMTLYAQWSIITHTVTFNSGDGTVVPDQIVNYDSVATAPDDPSRTGYTFTGWNTAATGGTAWNFTTKVTADTTLYAQWTIITHTVTFNSGDGTVVPDQIVNYDSVATAPDDPSRTGYTFTGWNTAATAGTAWNFTTKVTADTTLYAQWTAELAPTITLDLDLDVGDIVANTPVTMSGVGLLAGSEYIVIVRSTPVTIAFGSATSTGTFTGRGVMPAGLSAGQHTVTLSAIAADGSAIFQVAYLTINEAGTVTYLSYRAADPTKPAVLAATGADVRPWGIATVLLLLAGGALLVTRRKWSTALA